MAVMEKIYAYPPSVLLNLINDIAEMRKAPVSRIDGTSLLVDTEMYGIRTGYVFRTVPVPSGTSVTVETEGDDGYAEQCVRLMFATLENMLGLFRLEGGVQTG